MRTTSKLLALALTAATQATMAAPAPVVLDFEDITTTAPLGGDYHGANISGAAWGAASAVCYNDPSQASFIGPGAKNCGALWLTDGTDATTTSSLTIGLTDGLLEAVSFIYSGSVDFPHLNVRVLDAAGNDLNLGKSDLSASYCGTYQFCNWSAPITLDLSGSKARYVSFTASNSSILLDDVNLAPQTTTGRLPEPTSAALALGALGALGWSRKRAAR